MREMNRSQKRFRKIFFKYAKNIVNIYENFMLVVYNYMRKEKKRKKIHEYYIIGIKKT